MADTVAPITRAGFDANAVGVAAALAPVPTLTELAVRLLALPPAALEAAA